MQFIDEYARSQEKIPFSFNDKPFYYVVPMFPYPSGHIHMGHIRNYSISNAIARYKKYKGFNVLHPIGFDSFGLPAETAAIRHRVSPKEWTESNIAAMEQDFHAMGFDFDWDHTVQTHKFEYYKFEQEIFKKAWERGLIYKKDKYVNFDPVDNTILSNEQVQNGRGWRSGAVVVRRKMPMYFFNMKHYARELMENSCDWPKKVIEMQRNWIGFKSGEDVVFDFPNSSICAFHEAGEHNCIMVGINHPWVEKMEKNPDYIEWFESANTGSVSQKSAHQRAKYDTGHCVDFKGQMIPIFIDIQRDEEAVFTFDKAMVAHKKVEAVGIYRESHEATFAALKDWCISRQRYWGNPIPIIHCDDCGDQVVEGVVLPENLMPDGQGNILDKSPDFTQCVCPRCHKPAHRCTDTMDTFVQSSWYYQRYVDPKSSQMIPTPQTQIDCYVGGVEHATMHLIYTRFFHKMLRDFGMVSTDEPIHKLITQGMVCKKYTKPDGSVASAKMSKSLGNVVAPQAYIDKYGSDTVKMFMIFAAPPGDNFDFDDAAMVGCYRFLQEVYGYFFEENKATKTFKQSQAVEALQKMTQYIEREFEGRGNLNTIIPQLMVTFKTIKKTAFEDSAVQQKVEEDFVTQLGIFAPHIAQYIMDFRHNITHCVKANKANHKI